MAMTSSTIRFSDDERSVIQSYATFLGKTFSETVREAALEAAEDYEDQLAFDEFCAHDAGEYVSWDEARKTLLATE